MQVEVNGTIATSTNTSISGNTLAKGAFTEVKVTIKYAANGARADGPFTVDFGGISLDYSTVDNNVTLISFNFFGTTYQAEYGMTWQEYINSKYNHPGFTILNGRVMYAGNYVVDSSSMVYSYQTIVEGEYYSLEQCCFDPYMRVLMADGTYRQIVDVQEGDMVMSLNEDTGEYVAQKVTQTIINKHSTDLVYVNLSNGTQIAMRAYHPLLTTEGYKSLRPEYAETKIDVGEVALLEIGDTLVGYEENVTVVSIEQRPEVENYYTYNLSVEGYHNYIVEGVVVHNAGCPDDLV